MAKLTEKQIRFIDYYIQLGNAAEAARKAGYRSRPDVAGSQNLVKLSIHIQERLKQMEEERIADGSEVLRYLTAVMRGEASEQIPLLCGEGFQELATKGVSIKDRVKAAELLGKRYGLFQDRVQLDGGSITVVIEDDYGDESQSPVE